MDKGEEGCPCPTRGSSLGYFANRYSVVYSKIYMLAPGSHSQVLECKLLKRRTLLHTVVTVVVTLLHCCCYTVVVVR